MKKHQVEDLEDRVVEFQDVYRHFSEVMTFLNREIAREDRPEVVSGLLASRTALADSILAFNRADVALQEVLDAVAS